MIKRNTKEDKTFQLGSHRGSGAIIFGEDERVELIDGVIRKRVLVASGMSRYRIRIDFVKGDTLTPQAFPDPKIEVSDVLV